MLNENELEGGFLWNQILQWWPLHEEKKQLKLGIPPKSSSTIQLTGSIKHCFYQTTNTINKNNNNYLPILIFFTGLGKTKLLTEILFDKLLSLNNQKFCNEIYGMDHMNISNLNEAVNEAIQLYKYCQATHTNRRILLIGHSLGSGIAAQVASHVALYESTIQQPLGLLLLSTSPDLSSIIRPIYFFKRLVQTISKLFLGNILDTDTALQYIQCPVKIIHTKDDAMFFIKIVKPLSLIVSEFTGKTPKFLERPGNHGELINNVEQLYEEIKTFLLEIFSLIP